ARVVDVQFGSVGDAKRPVRRDDPLIPVLIGSPRPEQVQHERGRLVPALGDDEVVHRFLCGTPVRSATTASRRAVTRATACSVAFSSGGTSPVAFAAAANWLTLLLTAAKSRRVPKNSATRARRSLAVWASPAS